MRVLIVGAGGREHALAGALRRSPRVEELFVAPGNAGTDSVAVNVPIRASDIDGLTEWTRGNGIDLTVGRPWPDHPVLPYQNARLSKYCSQSLA